MGPMLQQDVQNKLLSIEGIDEANVELVWDLRGTRHDDERRQTATGFVLRGGQLLERHECGE